MDHLLNLFMPRLGANEFYETDSDSGGCDDDDDDDDNNGGDCGGDAASNCSLYGSTTSNEGDIQDECECEDAEDDESAENANNLHHDALNDEYDYALNEHEAEVINDNFEPQIPAANNHLHFVQEFANEFNPAPVQNGYVNHEHDYAHDGQRDGVVVEVCPIHPVQHPSVISSINNMLSNVIEGLSPYDDTYNYDKALPLQSCYYYDQSVRSSQNSDECPTSSPQEQGTKRNVIAVMEDVEVKRIRTEECPQDVGAEITVRTEELFLTERINEEHYLSMDSIPDDTLLEIFSKLSVNSLINIAPVSKRWYELSKHKSLWLCEDVVYDRYHVNRFLRHVRAAKYLRTLDVSDLHAAHGEILSSLLNGPESVRRFSCFRVAHPRVIVELLERYQHDLEELNISISDERLSYGEGGTFKDGVKPRPGYLLKLISEMKNLRVIRFTGTMPSIGLHQGRVNPKWYFGELENPELKLQAIAMKFENPREILVQKFIIPFLRSKIPFLKELRLTSDIWKNKEVQEIVNNCDKLEALVRFPIDSLHALENCKQQFFIDFILGSWIDFQKIQRILKDYKGLSHIHEVSLRFCDQLYIRYVEQIPDTRLETFLPMLAESLHSCKRVHIYRWEAAPPFVESVHSTCALAKFLYALRRTLEEVHISDAFRSGKHFPQLMKVIKESVPHLKSRGIAVNCLGNRGLLFSVRKKAESVIPNAVPLLLEHGRFEFGSQ